MSSAGCGSQSAGTGTPAMPPLLRFLRARRANLNPTLRLPATTPKLALTLLVLAGHALVQAVDGAPGDPRAKPVLTECLTRLATSPIGDRVQPGDLAFALTDEQRQSADATVFARDEIRRFLTEAVPLRRAVAAPDQPALLVLDLTARPEAEDLMRVMATDNPADGADTVTRWRALGGLIRLEVTWLEPVHTELAVVLELDKHHEEPTAIAAGGCVALTSTDPADSLDTLFSLVRVATDGTSLSDVMAAAATARRR
ncbi:hypothetical protein P3T39_005790 [Kitasatospora sp. GP82]|nr:hypothetical protein [Kitasatospora sp. GP82]